MKPSRLLALATCAFAFWATSCPAAGESISFNAYRDSTDRDSNGEITIDGAGVLEIPASAWNNVTASGVPSEVKMLSSDKTTTSTINLTTSASFNGIWYLASPWTSVAGNVTKTTGNGQLFFNYMDSYQGSNNGSVSISNIPFTEYTLYIYPGSEGDNSADYGTMSAFQVTAGESPQQLIKGDGSSATVTASSLTDSWGTNQSFREENSVAPVLTEGVNYLKLTGLSGNLTITYPPWSGSRRAGMAGFQIVNTGNLITGSTFTASPSGTDVTFKDITWNEGTLTGGTLNTATLTLKPGSTLTFTEAVPTLNKLTLVSTGKVTLAVNGVTLDAVLAKVANFDFTGVAELDIGALTKSALTVPENVTLTMNAPGQVDTLTQNGKVKYAGGEALTLFDIHTAALNNKTTIIDKTISSVKTTSPTDRNSEGYFAINGSRTIELGENANITVSTRFAMADDDGASPVLNQNGGTITVKGTGTTNTTTIGTAVILGHWAGTPAYNLNKGTLSVANGAIMLGWSGNPTMTVGTSDGEAAPAKVIAKGIVSHGITDGQGQDGKLVLKPSGVIEVGSLGLNFSNTRKTGAVVELAGGLLKVTDDAPLALANQSGLQLTANTTISVASGKTLTVSTPFTGTGALTLTGGGTVNLSALGKNLPKIASLEAGTTLRVDPLISQSDRLTGSFSASLPLADGATLSGTIEYRDGDTWKTATVTTNGSTATLSDTFSTDATLTGSSWWWDYEFNGSNANANASTGSDTGTVTLEGDTNAKSYTEADSTGNRALYFQKTPWRNATYPAELTAVMRCQPGNYANTALIGFGSTTAGSKPTAIALVTGANPENGDMRLVLIIKENNAYTVTDLVEGGLNVANATTAQHLYAFSIATVADKTQIAVYVDGKRKTLYTHPTTIALTGGFQIGSLHGGMFTTGLTKYPDTGDSGTVDFLRVSQEVLTDAAIRAMANAYPYVSAKGTATRTVSTATATWEDETNTPWSQAMPDTATAAQVAPNAGTNVVLTASADTTITLNGTSAVTYESMTVEGTGAVTLSATKTSATMLASDLTVSTNLTVPAHRFTAGTVTVDEGKTLTFDCSGLDGWKETYVLTGYVEPEVAGRIAVTNTAIASSPFTYEKVQDSAGSVILRATASVKPLTATVPAGEVNFSALSWTLEGQPSTPDWNKTSVLSATLTLSDDATLTFDKDSAVAVKELILEGSGTLTLQKAEGAADFSSQTTRVNTSVNVAAGALSLGHVVLGPNVSLTLNESTYNLTTVSAAETVAKATRPTVILASNCTLAVPQALSSAHHNFNLTIAENTRCTTSGRWDICGSTLTVAGTLQKTDALWFGVSYGSLDAADSALVVTSTGEVQVSGPFYIGAWGNTSLNTVTVEGRCTLNTVQCHAASTVGFSVKENGVLTVNNTTVNNTNAVANVAVEQGGTLAWKGNITGSLTFAAGAKLDVANGTLSTGTVSIAEGGTVTVTGATTAGTTILTCQNPEALLTQLAGAPEGCLFAANAEKTAVVLTVEIPQVPVPGESGNKVELSANSKSVLQAVAEDKRLTAVTAVSGSTTVNGTPTTLTAEAIDNALAVFGKSVVTVDGTELKVDYNFGIVSVEPSYVQGNLSMLTVKVKVTTTDGTLATLAEGATLELVDGPTVLLDAGGGFYHLETGEYAGYFYPVDTVRYDNLTANGLIGRSFKVRAKKE